MRVASYSVAQPNPRSKGQQRKGGGDKNKKMPVRREKFEANCDRDEEQEPIHRNGSVTISRRTCVLPIHPVHCIAL